MIPDPIAGTPLPRVLVYHREPVEESFEFTEQRLPMFQNVMKSADHEMRMYF